MSIKSIFYSHFHADKGRQVLYQVPGGSVALGSSSGSRVGSNFNSTRSLNRRGDTDRNNNNNNNAHDHNQPPPPPYPHDPPLFEFEAVSEYIIPKQELCDRLVTFCTNGHRILGYPICLEDRKYDRNEFIFNFAIVLDEDEDFAAYKPVVRKIARLFRALEEQSGFLWNEVTRSQVHTLIEQVMEDLNNYCECMIPINESNTINLKLFPIFPPPPPVKAYHVPICTVKLKPLMDANWDLTMQKIVPYINGVDSVRRISEMADADLNLAKKCISELLYYGCVILVDVFRFSNIYAPTSTMPEFVADTALQDECRAYVCSSGPQSAAAIPRLSFPNLFELYTSLRQGTTLKSWAIENAAALKDIDIRRFIQFGIIKGFLYRVHKYPVYNERMMVHHGTGGGGLGGSGRRSDGIETSERGALPLLRYLDGSHHFDSICTDLQQSEKEVLKTLSQYGDVQFVHR